jgi:exonuclease SbcC
VIRYLHLSNFRRHADTEISFDQTGQIVLIAGRNGAGKSTLIEAIVYALYGEGRHGNRHIDRMIRRGAELEGMRVELEFDVADTVYRVDRKRDNKLSSAVLYGNDVALTEGSREVTTEITNLLGMDAKGFRLAVLAQQKELDGLASMRPAERASTLARLLRLDVVTQARDKARGVFRSERDALRGLGSIESIEEIDKQITKATAERDGIAIAIESGREAVARIDAELTESAQIESAYQSSQATHARLVTLAESAHAELARREAELAKVDPGEDPGPMIDAGPLTECAGEVERQIAVAEASAKLAAQASMLDGELSRVERRIDELSTEHAGLAPFDESAAQAALDRALAHADMLGRRREELLGEQARATSSMRAADDRLTELGDLGATCDTCGQEISHEHLEDQARSAQSARAGASMALNAVSDQLDQLEVDQLVARRDVDTARRDVEVGREAAKRRVRIDEEMDDLRRRQSTYRDQLERIEVGEFDLDGLLAQRSELAMGLADAKSRNEAVRVRELVLERVRNLEEACDDARARAREADEVAEAGRVPEDLVERHRTLERLRASRAGEVDLGRELVKQQAVLTEQLNGLEREKARVVAQQARKLGLETKAQVASETAGVLDAVATRLNQQIRPALEGAVGEILSRLSDGRFDAVSLDEEYNLSVRDQGAMRPLSEFSGGEIDLIALAMRLALATVVSDRHGSGGAGFLILDECFGSQDAERRGSILTALRGLRGAYGQILLISHVGGIEDSADRVVEVSVDDETGIASAEVG